MKNGFSSAKSKKNEIELNFLQIIFRTNNKLSEFLCFSPCFYRDGREITATMLLDEIHGRSGGK